MHQKKMYFSDREGIEHSNHLLNPMLQNTLHYYQNKDENIYVESNSHTMGFNI
jgi:hypothetical protein